MPVRNEARYIERAIESVLSQTYPAGMTEIFVADGMSKDGTREIIERYCESHTNLHLIDNPGKIVPTGLNAALRQANGRVIIRVDGHCQIAPDYVQRCIAYLSAAYLGAANYGGTMIGAEHLKAGNVDGVGGPLETVGETCTAGVIAAAMSSRFGVGGSAFRTIKDRTMLVDSVAFPAYTREIIHKAGLYDEELVRDQDDEYNYRIRELGGVLLLASDVRSKYYSRSSLLSLWRQYFQYGCWKVRVLQKHPRQMKLRQFVPGIFVGALIISSLMALFSPLGRLLLAAIIGLYLLVDLAASLLTAARVGWRYLPLLPLVYGILHLSYGFGFLWGLVKFANRWGDRCGKVPDWSNNVESRSTAEN